MIQLYIHSFSFRFFSHIYYHRILHRVLCAVFIYVNVVLVQSFVNIIHNLFMLFCFVLFYFILFYFFRVTSAAYGSSNLGVESELQLQAYNTSATAIGDPGCVYDLHWSPRQCQTLNTLIEARDKTCILMNPSQFCYSWTMTGTLEIIFI